MSTVAISFTSESSDRYLSLFTDVTSIVELVDRLEETYGDEFAYLYVDAVCTDNGTEQEVQSAVAQRISEAGDYE